MPRATCIQYSRLIKRALAGLLAGVFLLTSIFSWAGEERMCSISTLAPELRTNSAEFKRSLTITAICEHIERGSNLDNKFYLNDVLAKLDVGKNPNITVLPYEVIIDVPDEGLAIRYFDPAKTNVLTPYSDVLRLDTKIINPQLNRQIIHRTKALPVPIDDIEGLPVKWTGGLEKGERLRIACMQIKEGDFEEDTGRMADMVLSLKKRLGDNAPDLVIFPEMTGQECKSYGNRENRLKVIAAKTGISIGYAVNLNVHTGKILYFVIQPSGKALKFTKWSAEEDRVFQVNNHKINLLICAEIERPADDSGFAVKFNKLVRNKKPDVLLTPCDIDASRIKNFSEILFKKFATPVVYVNTIQKEAWRERASGLISSDNSAKNFVLENNKEGILMVDVPAKEEKGARRLLTVNAYVDKNEGLFKDMLGENKEDVLLRVPIEVIEAIGIDNIKDFLVTFQKARNGYIELYHTSGAGEVSESVYQRYGMEKKALPSGFKRARENTITLFPAFKGEEIDQAAIRSRLGGLGITPEETVLSPIGLQHDPAGLIRAAILGLKIADIARLIKEKGIDLSTKDAINVNILHELRDALDVKDFNDFNLTPDDIIALATGNINNILIALKKLIKLLPITPIDAEELRQIYQHAREVPLAA